jgi:hypothetical protein
MARGVTCFACKTRRAALGRTEVQGVFSVAGPASPAGGHARVRDAFGLITLCSASYKAATPPVVTRPAWANGGPG